MHKILTVVGARPQFIKAAAVTRVIGEKKEFIECLVHTGQHYDANMSEVFFKELGIPEPDYNLGVTANRHGEMTGLMLQKIEQVLIDENPELCLIYGDTNSTVAAALAASKLQIQVAHVESGLRSFNRAMPEEINRVVSDHLSDLLFAPTSNAVKQLLKEGIKAEKVFQVGDVMYDVSNYYASKAQNFSEIVKNLSCVKSEYILMTIHRQENTDSKHRLKLIADAVEILSTEKQVIFPIHPRTKKKLEEFGLSMNGKNLTIIDPVGYLDMVELERNAGLIVTDSGGVQKEAYFYRVPCVTLRAETEWLELIDAGWNRLGGNSVDEVISAVRAAFGSTGKEISLYGDGDASEKIYGHIKRSLEVA